MKYFKASDRSPLQLLEDIFEIDPLINEIGFEKNLCDGREAKMDFLLDNHKLAISYSVLAKIYREAFVTLEKWRRHPKFGSNLTVTSVSVNLTRAILISNTDCAFAWNTRKALITANQISIQQELMLLDLLFTKHPKSSEGWAHRSWLLQKMVGDGIVLTEDYLSHEVNVCTRVVTAYPRNYYAWTHRLLVMKNTRNIAWLLKDLQLLTEWTNRCVSDHSSFHYRLQLMEHLSKLLTPGEFACLIAQEFVYNKDLVVRYREHESLWCARRGLFTLLIDFVQTIRQSQSDDSDLCDFSNAIFSTNTQDSLSKYETQQDLDLAIIRRFVIPAELDWKRSHPPRIMDEISFCKKLLEENPNHEGICASLESPARDFQSPKPPFELAYCAWMLCALQDVVLENSAIQSLLQQTIRSFFVHGTPSTTPPYLQRCLMNVK